MAKYYRHKNVWEVTNLRLKYMDIIDNVFRSKGCDYIMFNENIQLVDNDEIKDNIIDGVRYVSESNEYVFTFGDVEVCYLTYPSANVLAYVADIIENDDYVVY